MNVQTPPEDKGNSGHGSLKEGLPYVTNNDPNDSHGEEELHRALNARQISMIAIGGAVGTGLILGSGSALRTAGPVGLLIAYIIMGSVCYGVITALGEMTSWIPHKKGFAGHSSQFVSGSFGFAVGYNYLFKLLVLVPSQLNATAILLSYWRPDINGGIWITVFGAVIIFLNIAGGIRVFGHLEYTLSFLKIVVLVGLLILSICINAGGTPSGDYIGFRYWTEGRAFRSYLVPGATGRFLGTWSAMVLALFAYTGTEICAVTAGEARNPRKSIPRAIKSTFYRILFFYILLIFLVGLIVPSDSDLLVGATKSKNTAAASPFVVAIKIAQIQTLPSILNGCLLIFTFSAANSDLYIASRTLYGLAKSGQAPHIFTRCNNQGTPWVSIAACSLFISLAYINVSSGGSTTFGYLTSTVTIFGGITWWAILITHQRFLSAMKAQGFDRKSLPYRSPFQPFFGYYSIFVISLVILFKGFAAFIGPFNYKSFITNYIGLPIFVALIVGWQLAHRTKWLASTEVDLYTGAREGDIEGEDENKEDIERLTKKQRLVRFVKQF
ncbi:unnamed protein product [Parajaminaea phylloscopi]